MEEKNEFNQLSFLTSQDFTFGNAPLYFENIPDELKKSEDIKKIVNYNNRNKGIITNDFLIWALETGISYDVISWFIKDFSGQSDQELLWIIDSFFKCYTIYLDESNNCVKFRFKDIKGNTNVKWYNDFVLSGIAFEGDSDPIRIEDLFRKFELQKNITDVKLKHIAKYNGEDSERFVDILKSDKVSILLETLLQSNRIYIHWATQNLLYYSLVDIVDSVLELPFIHDEVKNILYKYAVKDQEGLLSLLAQYDYPNIKKDMISSFCEQLIRWIESLTPQSIEEDFALELLRQGTKTSRRINHLLFLEDNTDKLLIENFVPIYAMRAATFPNSNIHFDKCGIVESNIQTYIDTYCVNKTPNYDFLNSKNSRWIQLSDMVSGINGALMAYVNLHDIRSIRERLRYFDETQNRNLVMFMKLRKISSRKNKYFDNMSKNLPQIERIQFLMEYCNL
ncbi:hypothetical protein DWY35_05845 [Ruminococcus sp. AF25-13]|nr:hypothetical protein DXD07_00905 [Ruminococcus sp. TF10-6]RGF28082.1 hypothetical protein DW106_07485 [Ruminococcus sp. AM09-18-1]RGG05097.1 hypothetical protein DWY85_01085 [Ruminococcus sp. AF27-3]RGG12455.1 hypothetical protein DWY75_01085 [Ruminococcus sp. AF27-11AA]RGG29773.1 hypothetical protein DWY35_05845 [Ruminococcus sp. AF25-13]RGG40991.1 hypothetical protein DWY13_00690 [Ruminococcus sp. AF24-16]RGI18408.1 hypothetical protein DXD00_00900 [Ruminococcus sp. TF10-12AC]